MSGNQFIPSFSPSERPATTPKDTEYPDTHGLSALLQKTAQYGFILMAVLLPIFFVPGLFGSLGFGKVLFAATLSAAVLITVSLVALRKRTAASVLPGALGVYGLFVLAALASGLLSSDVQDAIRGATMETQTVGFLALLGVVMLSALVLQGSKLQSMKFLIGFAVSAALLLVYVLLRIVFGAEFLPLGSFGSQTLTPLGGFNDIAIFAGLTVILGLITLAQLPVRGGLQYGVATLVVLSLIVLSVVNFFNIWVVLGFIGLLLFMYLIARDTLFVGEERETEPVSRMLIVLTALVCLVSTLFIISGSSVGSQISEWTGINYVEVRPSFEATTNIMTSVYSDNVLLGVGPNRFADAWREHKSQSINNTIFWDTNFTAGNGFVSTVFVNTGLLGGLLLVAFHGWFLFIGYRMLMRSEVADKFWYFFGLASFSAAAFIWGMSYVYVPGAGILLLAAVFTGCTFVAAGALLPSTVFRMPLAVNQRRGFVLMSLIVLLISAGVIVLYALGKQYVAQAQFVKAQTIDEGVSPSEQLTRFEQVVQQSFNLYPNDAFVRTLAQLQLGNLNTLVGVPEPSEEQQQRFLQAAQQGISYASQAVAADPSNPNNHWVLANIFATLAVAGVEDAGERAQASLNEAQSLDPLNPRYNLVAAQIAAQTGDVEAARTRIDEALQLKGNYTDALFLAAQIDISEGDLEAAIARTRAITTFEPNNPTRYYQLGILLTANEQTNEAINAFQAAIARDPQYANARYLLALAYLENDQDDAALEQLRIVAQTNSDNEQLQTLISQVESGTYTAPEQQGDITPPVADGDSVSSEDSAIITDGDVDTDLVSPVNTVSNDEADSEQNTSAESANTATTTE